MEQLKEQSQTRFDPPPLISIVCDSELDLTEQSYRNFEQADIGSASGDCLLFLPSGSKLRNDALFMFAKEVTQGADCVYCDEDECGKNPLFKPDYSPQTLKSCNYIGGALLVSRDLFNRAGGKHYSTHDFALNMTRQAKKVSHIPRVLLRQKKRAPLMITPWRPKATTGMVSVILINTSGYEALKETLLSIEQVSVYDNYELVIADAAPYEKRLERLYVSLERNKAAIVYRCADPSNLAADANKATALAHGKFLLFMSAGTTPKSGDFMGVLMEMAAERGIGAAGGRLEYALGTLNSCGVVVGLFGGLFSLYEDRKIEPRDEYCSFFTDCIRNVSALRLDGLMVKRSIFDSLSGFDETLSRVGFAEEFCHRLQQRMLGVVYVPQAVLVVQSSERPTIPDAKNSERLMDVFRPMLVHGDPMFNPNLDYNCGAVQVAAEPISALTLHGDNGWWT